MYFSLTKLLIYLFTERAMMKQISFLDLFSYAIYTLISSFTIGLTTFTFTEIFHVPNPNAILTTTKLFSPKLNVSHTGPRPLTVNTQHGHSIVFSSSSVFIPFDGMRRGHTEMSHI
jgi:hypothetical protein